MAYEDNGEGSRCCYVERSVEISFAGSSFDYMRFIADMINGNRLARSLLARIDDRFLCVSDFVTYRE